MSAILAASCCCDPSTLWYALKCDLWTSNYCCPDCCDGAVNRIEFCDAYLAQIGIPLPPDPTKCYIIAFNGCTYVLTGTDVGPCPNPLSPYPQNQGYLVAIIDPSGDPPVCCQLSDQEQIPVGGIGDLEVEGEPVIGPPEDPCEDTIAECYLFCDMFGTSDTQNVVVSSGATASFVDWGVPWFAQCDTNRPVTFQPMTKAMSQEVGICYQLDPGLDTQVIQPLVQDGTFGHYVYTKTTPAACDDCTDALYCCQVDPPDPCDPGELPCAGQFDLDDSYTVTTLYDLKRCNTNYEADAISFTFPACYATQAGLDLADPADKAAIEALYDALVDADTVFINTGWGTLTALQVRVCNYKVNVFSGNPGHIADRVNARMGALVKATGIYPWFWFGNRQSCIDCCPTTSPCPNQRPPYTIADLLVKDRIVIDVASQTVTVVMRGVSVQWRAGVCQKLEPWSVSAAVQNAAISLNCVSPAEYSAGVRFVMQRIYEPYSDTSICVDTAFFEVVPGCLEVEGYPVDDVTIGGIVIIEGWNTLFSGLCTARTTCRDYPYIYDVTPCEPPEDYVYPSPCVRKMFQYADQYVQTLGDTITVGGC